MNDYFLDEDSLTENEIQKIKGLNGKEVRNGKTKKVGVILGSSYGGILHIESGGRQGDRLHISEFEDSEWELTGEEGDSEIPQIYSCRVCGEALERGKLCYCEVHQPPEKCSKCFNQGFELDESSNQDKLWKCRECRETYEILSVRGDGN